MCELVWGESDTFVKKEACSEKTPPLTPLGLKSPKDLFFGTREGLVGLYERAIALPPRPRVGRARAAFFPPVIPASAAVAPLNGGE